MTKDGTVSSRKFKRLTRNSDDAQDSFKRRAPTITLMLRDNRFWIGEALYPRYVEYSERQRALVQAYKAVSYRVLVQRAAHAIRTRQALDDALAQVQERRQELIDARSDVVDVMNEL
jgi:hypothetical protein